MGRELRKVPADWVHPKKDGRHIPLYDGYEHTVAEFQKRVISHGIEDALDYFGEIHSDNYMLIGVTESERTHFMMYEDTSEGTPISPAFATAEELCRWLTDTRASAFGRESASYQWWMGVCTGKQWTGLVYVSESNSLGLAPVAPTQDQD